MSCHLLCAFATLCSHQSLISPHRPAALLNQQPCGRHTASTSRRCTVPRPSSSVCPHSSPPEVPWAPPVGLLSRSLTQSALHPAPRPGAAGHQHLHLEQPATGGCQMKAVSKVECSCTTSQHKRLLSDCCAKLPRRAVHLKKEHRRHLQHDRRQLVFAVGHALFTAQARQFLPSMTQPCQGDRCVDLTCA